MTHQFKPVQGTVASEAVDMRRNGFYDPEAVEAMSIVLHGIANTVDEMLDISEAEKLACERTGMEYVTSMSHTAFLGTPGLSRPLTTDMVVEYGVRRERSGPTEKYHLALHYGDDIRSYMYANDYSLKRNAAGEAQLRVRLAIDGIWKAFGINHGRPRARQRLRQATMYDVMQLSREVHRLHGMDSDLQQK